MRKLVFQPRSVLRGSMWRFLWRYFQMLVLVARQIGWSPNFQAQQSWLLSDENFIVFFPRLIWQRRSKPLSFGHSFCKFNKHVGCCRYQRSNGSLPSEACSSGYFKCSWKLTVNVSGCECSYVWGFFVAVRVSVFSNVSSLSFTDARLYLFAWIPRKLASCHCACSQADMMILQFSSSTELITSDENITVFFPRLILQQYCTQSFFAILVLCRCLVSFLPVWAVTLWSR